jgi:hypothetical protein
VAPSARPDIRASRRLITVRLLIGLVPQGLIAA